MLRLAPPERLQRDRPEGNHSYNDTIFLCYAATSSNRPLNCAESTPISDKSRLRQAFSEQVASASRAPTSYKSYCLSRATFLMRKDRAVAQLEKSASVSETLCNLLSVRVSSHIHVCLSNASLADSCCLS
jgi:hypothetical protein